MWRSPNFLAPLFPQLVLVQVHPRVAWLLLLRLPLVLLRMPIGKKLRSVGFSIRVSQGCGIQSRSFLSSFRLSSSRPRGFRQHPWSHCRFPHLLLPMRGRQCPHLPSLHDGSAAAAHGRMWRPLSRRSLRPRPEVWRWRWTGTRMRRTKRSSCRPAVWRLRWARTRTTRTKQSSCRPAWQSLLRGCFIQPTRWGASRLLPPRLRRQRPPRRRAGHLQRLRLLTPAWQLLPPGVLSILVEVQQQLRHPAPAAD
mmetsp:Transcript_25852/g.65915  ORF Transcript_25852/g.65915 Transcript_25852/m.65915 type:complete len:252 (+) Transcript_25852:379-1134(+)